MKDEIPIDAPLWKCTLKKSASVITKNTIKALLVLVIGIAGYLGYTNQTQLIPVYQTVITVVSFIPVWVDLVILCIMLLLTYSMIWCVNRVVKSQDTLSVTALIICFCGFLSGAVLGYIFGTIVTLQTGTASEYNTVTGLILLIFLLWGSVVGYTLGAYYHYYYRVRVCKD
jgi:hypothetical protein